MFQIGYFCRIFTFRIIYLISGKELQIAAIATFEWNQTFFPMKKKSNVLIILEICK